MPNRQTNQFNSLVTNKNLASVPKRMRKEKEIFDILSQFNKTGFKNDYSELLVEQIERSSIVRRVVDLPERHILEYEKIDFDNQIQDDNKKFSGLPGAPIEIKLVSGNNHTLSEEALQKLEKVEDRIDKFLLHMDVTPSILSPLPKRKKTINQNEINIKIQKNSHLYTIVIFHISGV